MKFCEVGHRYGSFNDDLFRPILFRSTGCFARNICTSVFRGISVIFCLGQFRFVFLLRVECQLILIEVYLNFVLTMEPMLFISVRDQQ